MVVLKFGYVQPYNSEVNIFIISPCHSAAHCNNTFKTEIFRNIVRTDVQSKESNQMCCKCRDLLIEMALWISLCWQNKETTESKNTRREMALRTHVINSPVVRHCAKHCLYISCLTFQGKDKVHCLFRP